VFKFCGDLEISKSWMNRALILQSFDSDLKISGSSGADDVKLLEQALCQFKNNETQFNAGHGGTTFRFLALRISRKPGEYFIGAHQSLLLRPQKALVDLLSQLGVMAALTEDGLKIKSTGWKKPTGPVSPETDQSSQFLSALALSAIDIDFNIDVNLPSKMTSQSYFGMTTQLLRQAGVEPFLAHQKIKAKSLVGEVDVSSAFALVSAAVINGAAEITNWNNQSVQPDIEFVNFFNKMNIQFVVEKNSFKIKQQAHFIALKADLSQCPDLFPVLAVLCALAQGRSELFNAPQLKHKESDRIEKTYELLTRCRFKVEKKSDGMIIYGDPGNFDQNKDLILFDPAHDHRMAMAAGLLILRGFPIQLTNFGVVNKSYPQFFKHVGIAQ
jgi:3-phosphoshikimate 1-carboxyvinyltransferase